MGRAGHPTDPSRPPRSRDPRGGNAKRTAVAGSELRRRIDVEVYPDRLDTGQEGVTWRVESGRTHRASPRPHPPVGMAECHGSGSTRPPSPAKQLLAPMSSPVWAQSERIEGSYVIEPGALRDPSALILGLAVADSMARERVRAGLPTAWGWNATQRSSKASGGKQVFTETLRQAGHVVGGTDKFICTAEDVEDLHLLRWRRMGSVVQGRDTHPRGHDAPGLGEEHAQDHRRHWRFRRRHGSYTVHLRLERSGLRGLRLPQRLAAATCAPARACSCSLTRSRDPPLHPVRGERDEDTA